MKKSTIFKILTLFLTFIIFSCCSGCLFALGLQLKENEERHQRLIEKQKERKAQADALIPEIDGYIFEALPKAAFANQEDWESKGFLDWGRFYGSYVYENYGYDQKTEKDDNFYYITILYHNDPSNNQNVTELLKLSVEKYEYENKMNKFKELFQFTTDYMPIGSIHYQNGEYFFVLEMQLLDIARAPLYGPPALFLLDFENNTMQYVGYAKGWFEYEIKYEEFYDIYSICFKLTKES